MIIARHTIFMALTDLLDFHDAKLRILFEIKKSFFSCFFFEDNKFLKFKRLHNSLFPPQFRQTKILQVFIFQPFANFLTYSFPKE